MKVRPCWKLSRIITAKYSIFLPQIQWTRRVKTPEKKRGIVLTLSTISDVVNKCCFHGDGLLLYPASHEITARWCMRMRESRDRKLCDVIDLI